MHSETAEAVLSLNDVWAGYGASRVLRGLDLTIEPGQIYALLGPNGAGKSTAARVACGLLRPSQGRLRRSGPISLAPQDNALFPTLTIRENLQVIARAGGASRAGVEPDVERALRLTVCDARGDERIESLSGGWRRRANLAAALVGRPVLIVADEPTEGVDAETRVALSRALRAAADDGASCLLICHDARFVEGVADKVGFLSAGRKVREGRPADLLAEAFGARHALTVRLPAPPVADLDARLAEAGLAASDDRMSWRGLYEDPFGTARKLAMEVEGAGGEMAVGKPDLDDLAALLAGERS